MERKDKRDTEIGCVVDIFVKFKNILNMMFNGSIDKKI